MCGFEYAAMKCGRNEEFWRTEWLFFLTPLPRMGWNALKTNKTGTEALVVSLTTAPLRSKGFSPILCHAARVLGAELII
jgi:hypothetical protein